MTSELATTLSELKFMPPQFVMGRASIADLFPKQEQRCGIYVLHFADGSAYVGQAVDVVRRYAQHRRTHVDIEQLSFNRTQRSQLNFKERVAIEAIERCGTRLRNISLVSIAPTESDFDLIMSQPEQERWLAEGPLGRISGSRLVNEKLRARYNARYQEFLALPFSNKILSVLRTYVTNCIPAMRDGEVAFWSCSCLPHYSMTGITVYSRININWQEVFTVFTMSNTQPIYGWHLAQAPLEQAFGKSLRKLRMLYPSLEIEKHRYRPGGQDQIALYIEGSRRALRLMDNPDVKRAIREFNLRLCRKGPCAYGRYHCLDLADHLVDD